MILTSNHKKSCRGEALDYFEQREVWHPFLDRDPHFNQKARIMLSMIPQEVEAVLDVGCGNGVLTGLLRNSHFTVGLDKSRAALSFCGPPVILGNATQIPVKPQAFDLIFSSEFLEHLTGEQLSAATAEMQRIAGAYILISVPFEEHLPLRFLKCPACSRTFHIWGHRQRFTLKRLTRLFPQFRLLSWVHCGVFSFSYHPLLLRLRQWVGQQWYDASDAFPVCPGCGNRSFPRKARQRIVAVLDDLNRFQFKSAKAKYPYWIVALYARN